MTDALLSEFVDAAERVTAARLLPRYAEHFAKVTDEAKAEAALIVLYGAQQGCLT